MTPISLLLFVGLALPGSARAQEVMPESPGGVYGHDGKAAVTIANEKGSRFHPALDLELAPDFLRAARKAEIRINEKLFLTLHNFSFYDPDAKPKDEQGVAIQRELRRKLRAIESGGWVKAGPNIVEARFLVQEGGGTKTVVLRRTLKISGQETWFGSVAVVEDSEQPMPETVKRALGGTVQGLCAAYLPGKTLLIQVGHSNSFATKSGMKLMTPKSELEAAVVGSHEFAHLLFHNLAEERQTEFRTLFDKARSVPGTPGGAQDPPPGTGAKGGAAFVAATNSVIAWFNESNFVDVGYPMGHAYDDHHEMFASAFNSYHTYPDRFRAKSYEKASAAQRGMIDEVFAFYAALKP